MKQLSFSIGTIALTMLLAACGSSPSAHSTTPAGTGPAATEQDQTAHLAQQHAQRLSDALKTKREPVVVPEAPAIEWISPQAHQRPKPIEPEAPTPVDQPVQPETRASTAPERPATQLTRAELLDQLHRLVDTSADPDMAKALAMANLSLLDPQHKFEVEALSSLDPAQRRAVALYQQLAASLMREVEVTGSAFDADAAQAQLAQVFGQQPIRIRNIELCKRVRGFGVFDPFEDYVFTAGRENPMIVYVEVDHFRTLREGDKFTVRLRQEVTLYNHSDGLAVWRESPVEIVDESRNQRRDFFVVQMIRLPANLSVGKYMLKVSLTDAAGGSVDERSIPISVVTGNAMVGK